jgi:DNA repair ATPase RecN
MKSPFQDESVDKKSGLKLKNPPREKSADPVQKLSEEAEEFLSKKEELKLSVQKLTNEFLSVIDKKTVKADIGPKELEHEKSILNKIVNIANLINEDPDFPEGFGSLMVNTINLQTSLKFRDRINEIEFAVRKTIGSLNHLNTELLKLKNG